MRVVAFDVETIPTRSGVARLMEKKGAEITAPGNYKDPAKIAAIIEEKRAGLQAQCEKEASFSPLFGQVCAVSAWDGRDGGAIHLCSEGIDGSEARLLQAAAEALQDADLLVGFNSHSFDVPFLTTRMLVHGIVPPENLQARRYSLHPHADLRMFLGQWDEYAKGNLADWCALFGVPCPDKDLGLTGADVARLVRENQWQLLEDYSFGGAISTWNLLEKCWPALRLQIPGARGVELPDSQIQVDQF